MASRRRLARAGGVAARAGVPPSALSSRHDPLWSDPVEVALLAEQYRLPVTFERDWQAWKCFDVFRQAWCEANGLASAQPGRFERAAVQELGIDVSGSARYRILARF